MNAVRRLAFLRKHGAHRTPHRNGTLLEHLQGTYRLLKRWGNPLPLCNAGLFHSIYGTGIFRHRSVSFSKRSDVRRVVGTKAEQLAYLFAIADRPKGLLLAGRALVAGSFQVPAHERSAVRCLLEIECANLIDQGACGETIQELHRLSSIEPSLLSMGARRALATVTERRAISQSRPVRD